MISALDHNLAAEILGAMAAEDQQFRWEAQIREERTLAVVLLVEETAIVGLHC
jgi:hypothetical protein